MAAANILFRALGLGRIAIQAANTSKSLATLGRAANKVRRDFLSVAAGVGLVGSSTVAVRSLFRLLGVAFEMAAEKSNQLAEEYEGTKVAAREFTLALGQQITAGQNGTNIMGTFQGILNLLTQAVNGSAGEFRTLVNQGLILVIDSFRILNRTAQFLYQAFQVLRLVVIGLRMAFSAIYSTIRLLVRGGMHLFMSAIVETMNLVRRAVDAMKDLAILPESLRESLQGVSRLLNNPDAIAGLERFQEATRQGVRDAVNDGVAAMDRLEQKGRDAGNTMVNASYQAQQMSRGLRELRQRLREGRMEAERVVPAVEEVNNTFTAGAEAARDYAESVSSAMDRLNEAVAAARHERKLNDQAEREAHQQALDDLLEKAETHRRYQEKLEALRRRQHEEMMARMKEDLDMRSSLAESYISISQSVVDGTMKETKAYKKVTAMLLVAEGIRQLRTGIGYINTLGLQAQGVALIASSAETFAQAANLGFSGGRGGGGGGGAGGGGDIAFTQDITFVGSTAGQDTRAIADSIRRATRDGIMQAQGAS